MRHGLGNSGTRSSRRGRREQTGNEEAWRRSIRALSILDAFAETIRSGAPRSRRARPLQEHGLRLNSVAEFGNNAARRWLQIGLKTLASVRSSPPDLPNSDGRPASATVVDKPKGALVYLHATTALPPSDRSTTRSARRAEADRRRSPGASTVSGVTGSAGARTNTSSRHVLRVVRRNAIGDRGGRVPVFGRHALRGAHIRDEYRIESLGIGTASRDVSRHRLTRIWVAIRRSGCARAQAQARSREPPIDDGDEITRPREGDPSRADGQPFAPGRTKGLRAAHRVWTSCRNARKIPRCNLTQSPTPESAADARKSFREEDRRRDARSGWRDSPWRAFVDGWPQLAHF